MIVAENKEELDKIIKNLERWTDKNLMEVHVEKTKIAVFRNGRKKKEESWNHKGSELEVEKGVIHLGFWFSTTTQYSTHVKKAAGKRND